MRVSQQPNHFIQARGLNEPQRSRVAVKHSPTQTEASALCGHDEKTQPQTGNPQKNRPEWRQVYQETHSSAHDHNTKLQAIAVYTQNAQNREDRKALFIDTYA